MDAKTKEMVLQRVVIPQQEGTSKVMPLREAVARHVRPGMTLHFSFASSSCYALMYEVARQF